MTYNNRVIAGATLLSNPDNSVVNVTNIGYLLERNSKSAYNYIFWKILNWSSQQEVRFVDLGTSSSDEHDPVHKEKRKFGADILPVKRFEIPLNRGIVSKFTLLLRSVTQSL